MREDVTSKVRTSQPLLGSVARTIGVSVRVGLIAVGAARVGVLAMVGVTDGASVGAAVGVTGLMSAGKMTVGNGVAWGSHATSANRPSVSKINLRE